MRKEEAKQIMEGLILGDGSLNISPRGKNARFRLSRLDTPKFRAYLKRIAEALSVLGVELPLKHITARDRTYKGKRYIDLRTLSSPVLTRWRERWIISDKPKRRRIPSNFRLTPLSTAVWFEGDGSTTRYKKNQNRVVLTLASHQFGIDGNRRLQKLLRRDLGVEMNIHQDRRSGERGYFLRTTDAEQVNKFFDHIETLVSGAYRDRVKRPWLKVLSAIGDDGKRQLLKGPFIWQKGKWVKGKPPRAR